MRFGNQFGAYQYAPLSISIRFVEGLFVDWTICLDPALIASIILQMRYPTKN